MLQWHVGHHHHSEAKDYGFLAFINICGALSEFCIAFFLAQSTSAAADAIHALSHSFTFVIVAGVIWAARCWNFDEKRAKAIHNILSVFFLLLAFATLIYIALAAYHRLYEPVTVASGWMFVAACFGLATSGASMGFLRGMQHAHHIRTVMHSVLSADTLLDIGTSLSVLAGALLQYAGMEKADPAIALFVIVPWITFRLGYIFWDFIRGRDL